MTTKQTLDRWNETLTDLALDLNDLSKTAIELQTRVLQMAQEVQAEQPVAEPEATKETSPYNVDWSIPLYRDPGPAVLGVTTPTVIRNASFEEPLPQPRKNKPRVETNPDAKWKSFESPQRRMEYIALQIEHENRTRLEIAHELGVDESTVRKAYGKWLKRDQRPFDEVLAAAKKAMSEMEDPAPVPDEPLIVSPTLKDIFEEAGVLPENHHVQEPLPDIGEGDTLTVTATHDTQTGETRVKDWSLHRALHPNSALAVEDERPFRVEPLPHQTGEWETRFKREKPADILAFDALDRRVMGPRGVLTVGPSLFNALRALADGKTHTLDELTRKVQWMGKEVLRDQMDRVTVMLAHIGVLAHVTFFPETETITYQIA